MKNQHFNWHKAKINFFLDADKLANECNGKSWLIAYRQA